MTRRTPAQYSFAKLEFNERLLTKHFSPLGSRDIKCVVMHHMTIKGTGNGDALDDCYDTWQKREASAHYGVDGELVTQFVYDKDYAWACGDTWGNLHGLHIENANSTLGPKWLVDHLTIKTSTRLAANAHVLYKLGRPVSGKTLRQHDEFYETACPGPYLGGTEWAAVVKETQRVYDELTKKPATPTTPKPPAPKPPAARTTLKVSTRNGAGFNDAHGAGTAVARTKSQLVPQIRKVSPDVLLVQEWSATGTPDMVSTTDSLLTSHKREAMKKGTGVYRKKSTTDPLKAGVFELEPRFDGNDKQCSWESVTKNGIKTLQASVHLTPAADTAYDKKLKINGAQARLGQTRSAFRQCLAEAKRQGIKPQNVTIGGDFNSWTAVSAVAHEFGFVDSLSKAKKKIGRQYRSFNGWKKTKTDGLHLDHIYVHEDTEVLEWELVVDEDAADHNGITITVVATA